MYQVYFKKETGFTSKQLIGEYDDLEEAFERIEFELAKNKDLKYVIEQTTGQVDIYGELITRVVEKN